MHISLELLFAYTGYPLLGSAPPATSFRDVQLFLQDSAPRSDTLYIADATSPVCPDALAPCVLYVGKPDEPAPANRLSTQAQEPAAQVCARLRNSLATLDKWSQGLELLSAFGGAEVVQNMLDLTRQLGVIENPVILFNPELQIIACSEFVEYAESYACISSSHSRSVALDALPACASYAPYARQCVVYHAGADGNRYPQVHLRCQLSGDATELLTMTCASQAPAPHLLSLFCYLADKLRVSILKTEDISVSKSAGFLRDILTHFLLNESPDAAPELHTQSQVSQSVSEEQQEGYWIERASSLGISYFGQYFLVRIPPVKTPREANSTFLHRIEDAIPAGIAFMLNTDHFVLIRCVSDDAAMPEVWLRQLLIDARSKLGDDCPALAASDQFESLSSIAKAYHECVCMAEIARRLQGNAFLSALGVRNPYRSEALFQYQDYFDFAILSELTQASALPIGDSRLIRLCRRASETGNFSAIRVLFSYLCCQCSPAGTAKALYMHRNSVAYHISQLKERYGLDADDPQTGFRLMLTFRFLMLTWQADPSSRA